MITISHLTKIFEGKGPRVTALEDVNLEIGKGDIYGIIGMSGAGKSTLLRCLTLLERPTSGQIMLAGQDIASLSGAQLRAARRGMGVVFQGYNLLMQKTVAENVAFPLRLEKGYDRAAVPGGPRGRVPGPAFRRAEAARGHRPRAGHTARDAAV